MLDKSTIDKSTLTCFGRQPFGEIQPPAKCRDTSRSLNHADVIPASFTHQDLWPHA